MKKSLIVVNICLLLGIFCLAFNPLFEIAVLFRVSLIRELFSKKYPDIPVPEKVPMPRPVDSYFSDWKGPVRHEFKKDLDMSRFSGNQKWQLYCLEAFLNLYEPQRT